MSVKPSVAQRELVRNEMPSGVQNSLGIRDLLRR